MKTLLAFLVVNAALGGAHVVAAGVVRNLAELAFDMAPEAVLTPWPWFLIGAAGVAAALFFLNGVIQAARSWARG